LAKAYILISTSPGSEEEVLRDLEAIPEVKKTYVVDGVYDIVVHLEAGTMEELENAVSAKIAEIEEFRSSMTLVIR
jgi:DNA-binding Lrp family transcriptional regulator